MKIFKWVLAIIILVFAVLYYIDNKAKQEREEKELKASGYELLKSYHDNGKVKADAECINGVKNGKAHNYYTDGSVQTEFNYKNGLKHGNATWYHTNGKAYRVTPYLSGKREGMQLKYYKSGELLAKIPYSNNKIQPGTQEFTKTGKLVETYPNIKYETNVNHFTKHSLYVDFYLSNGSKRVKFEMLEVNGITKGLPEASPTSSGTFRFVIPPNTLSTQRVKVSAIFTTDLNNKKRVDQEFVIRL